MYDASDPRGRRCWIFPNCLACRGRIGHWRRDWSGDECGRRASGNIRIRVKVGNSGRIEIRIGDIDMRLHLRPLRILASTPHPHASSTPPRNSPRLPRLDTQRISAGSLHPHDHHRRVARPARHSVLCAVCSGVYQSRTRGDPGPRHNSRLILTVFVSPLSLASFGAAYAYYIVHHQSFRERYTIVLTYLIVCILTCEVEVGRTYCNSSQRGQGDYRDSLLAKGATCSALKLGGSCRRFLESMLTLRSQRLRTANVSSVKEAASR